MYRSFDPRRQNQCSRVDEIRKHIAFRGLILIKGMQPMMPNPTCIIPDAKTGLKHYNIQQETKTTTTILSYSHRISDNEIIMDTASPTPDSPQTINSPDLPPIPDHIVVTFDGKVREMMWITRDSADEERRQRPSSRPRYYAGDRSPRPEID